MDMGRLGHQRWWLFLLPCAVSLVFGILIVTEILKNNTTLFIGIAMVVEGVVDIAALIMMARSDRLNRQAEKEKKLAEEKQAEDQQAEAKEEAAAQPEEQPAETAETSEN